VRAAFERFRISLTGLSPEMMALIIVLGLVLGVFPVFGFPTLLCVAAAMAFRLNLPAIQLVNQVCAPLQYALLIPLARVGARITGTDIRGTVLEHLAHAVRNAVVGWCCFCVPVGLVLYLILAFTLRRGRSAYITRLETFD